MTEKLSLETTIKELCSGGIKAGITTHLNGLVAAYVRGTDRWIDADGLMEWDEAAEWLKSTAIQLYPESEFARRYRNVPKDGV